VTSVRITGGDTLHPAEYRRLRQDADWSPVAATDQALGLALSASWNATARAGDELVGMARLIEDGVLYASVWDMIVDRRHRGRGIGSELLRRLMTHVDDRDLVVLVATPSGAPLYRAAGFSEESRGSIGLLRRRETMPPLER
jgi:ribosomal protein S18 acetylase RimI-like enzyme